jgi:hypothetical protein
MSLYVGLLLLFNVIEPIALAAFAQRRGHVGFFWFVPIVVIAAAYTWYVDSLVANDPNFQLDPLFYEQVGQYREIGGLAIGSVGLPLIVSLVLLTWPKSKPTKSLEG